MAKRLRNKRLEICVSDTEYEMIMHRMKICNEKNMGRYMRRMAIDGCIFAVDTAAIKEMTFEINKIGNNINQIAHKVNGTGSIYETDVKNLKEAMKTLWQLQKSILSDEP